MESVMYMFLVLIVAGFLSFRVVVWAIDDLEKRIAKLEERGEVKP